MVNATLLSALRNCYGIGSVINIWHYPYSLRILMAIGYALLLHSEPLTRLCRERFIQARRGWINFAIDHLADITFKLSIFAKTTAHADV